MSRRKEPEKSIPSDYLHELKYRTSLPEVPSGPYLKPMPKLCRPLTDFAKYHFSSLERNYVWKPYFGPECGIELNLVDRSEVLVEQQLPMDPADAKYLFMTEKNQRSGADTLEKPWWLRHTSYLETHGDTTRAKVEKVVDVRGTSRSKQPTDPVSIVNIFEKSFNEMETWLGQQAVKPDPEIVSIHPILPDESMMNTIVTMGEFVVNPEYMEGGKDEIVDLQNNILTNVRVIDGQTVAQGNQTMISLIAKKKKKEDADSFGGNINSTEDEYNTSNDEDGELYSHVKDFRTELEADNRTFLWYFNKSKKEMSFIPITSTIRMKRASAEEASWHDARVKRRKPGEMEEELPDDEEENEAMGEGVEESGSGEMKEEEVVEEEERNEQLDADTATTTTTDEGAKAAADMNEE